jgi:sugar phosphate isomerase/epimerase
MSLITHDLLATCWTSAGNLVPRTPGTSPIPFEQRVQWVSETGWIGMGLAHTDLLIVRDTIGYPMARRILSDYGIQHFEVEFLTNWWTNGQCRRTSDAMRQDLFEAAVELGAPIVKVAPELVGDPVERAHFVDQFGQLCVEAARTGLRIGLEPIPFSNLASIADGVDVISDVRQPNSGLVIDIWHCFRSGTTPEDLEAMLAADQVYVVELDDGAEEIVGDLRNDTVNHRLLPGQGVFDVPHYVAALHNIGFRGHWGVEIISEIHRARPPKEALADAARAARTAISSAEGLVA